VTRSKGREPGLHGWKGSGRPRSYTHPLLLSRKDLRRIGSQFPVTLHSTRPLWAEIPSRSGAASIAYAFSGPSPAGRITFEVHTLSAEAKVAGHYSRGRIEDAILQAVARAGKDPASLTAADLAPVDEFHVGGIESTQQLAARMELRPGLRLLDVGCGIGGPARYFASEGGCKVTGIDLTEEFVQVATSLTRRVKLDHSADFHHASALQLPFEAATFDSAYMIHVGMNVADKAALFREVRRVLKPGSLFDLRSHAHF